LRHGQKDRLRLTSAILQQFGVEDRSTRYRALKALVEAGLIRVNRQHGKNPLVTIVDVEPSADGAAA
jgi:hypothetical protein